VPESTVVPESTAPASVAAAPQVTVRLVVLAAAGQVAPAGSVPSPTVSVSVTALAVAGQVKVVAAWLGAETVPALAVHAYVIADGFGATALDVSETTPPTVVVEGVAAADVQFAQSTGVPVTITPPASRAPPVVLQARKTLTEVVAFAVTVNGADVPAQVTVPSVDTAVSVIV